MPTNYDYFRAASKSVVPVKSRGGDSSLKLGRQSRGRESPVGFRVKAPVGGLGNEFPQELRHFYEIALYFSCQL